MYRSSHLIGGLLVLCGFSVLLGWFYDIAALKSLVPGWAEMKVNTAVGFCLSGLSLFVLSTQSQHRYIRISRVLFPAAIILLGASTLIEYLFSLDLKIDNIIYPDIHANGNGVYPGRMAPSTAVNFVLLGTGMLLIWNRLFSFLSLVTLPAFIIAYTSFLGYLYGLPAFFGAYASMAVHTAGGFLILILGIRLIRGDSGIIAVLTRRTLAGEFAQRLLPIALLLPTIIGWLILWLQRKGLYEAIYGLPLILSTVFGTAIFVYLIERTAVRLERQDLLLRQAMNMANIGGWEYIPADGRFYWSEITRQMYGVPREYVPTQENALDFYKDRASRKLMRRVFLNCLTKGEPYDVELLLTTPAGKHVWIRTIGEATFQNGICVRLHGTCQDVTPAKLAALELQDARARAEEAARAKSEFLSIMSHEIRTPMTGLIGMASLLDRTALDSQQKHYVDVLSHSSENLLRLLNDILDFSRIEAGKLELHEEPFRLQEICKEVTQLMSINAQRNGDTLDLEFDPLCNYELLGDAFRLRQILINLTGNAVKFTHGGTIKLRVREIEVKAGIAYLCFSVIDTGVGIPAHRIQALFTPFTQAEGSIARRYGGSGLGLSICQRLIHQMKGTIEIQSRDSVDDHGTVVNVHLGFKINQSTNNAAAGIGSAGSIAIANHAHGTLRQFRILVVDDDEIIRELLVEMLTQLGQSVDSAPDGPSAINKIAAMDYDIITMDTNMPEMSGFEVIRRIREKSTSYEHPVIVSVSASADAESAKLAVETGANDILTKPFTFSAVQMLLEKWSQIFSQTS